MSDGIHRGKKKESRRFQTCLIPWKWGPQQVVCCRFRDETGGLDTEEKKESKALKLPYLLCSGRLEGGFSESICWVWGPGITTWVMRKLGGEDLCDVLEMGPKGWGGLSGSFLQNWGWDCEIGLIGEEGKWKSTARLPALLVGETSGFTGDVSWI